MWSNQDFYVPFQRIKYSFKRDEIENSIVHRVQGVFRRASAKWKVWADSTSPRGWGCVLYVLLCGRLTDSTSAWNIFSTIY